MCKRAAPKIGWATKLPSGSTNVVFAFVVATKLNQRLLYKYEIRWTLLSLTYHAPKNLSTNVKIVMNAVRTPFPRIVHVRATFKVNMSLFVYSMLSMVFVFLASIPTVLIMAHFEPLDLTRPPASLCVYLAHFGLQFTVSIPLTITYYYR